MPKVRPIAIYLPQFHPIVENDEWWGKGFTEWTNVTKAKPLFKGHYQPHLPTDLGFYDLRLSEVREEQAKLAKEYGIHGFCYYHYWFNGKRLMERPFQEVFESGKPNFPFMLCWANENFTRAWDGLNKHILLEQKYSEDDDRAHIRYLIPYFRDDRYIKIDGKPVFCVYKSAAFPTMERTIQIWREEMRKEGLELYLCRFDRIESLGENLSGFDASVDFQPFSSTMFFYKKKLLLKRSIRIGLRRFFKLNKISNAIAADKYDYEDYVNYAISQPFPSYKIYPGITPSWDNSARKPNNYMVFINSTPLLYKKWIDSILKKFKPYSEEENFIFINAWNEWAEGNHLEPCIKWGREYLEKTKEALEENK